MISNISGKTKMACLLGHPVAHSISPKMHNEAFAKIGYDASYMAFDIPEDSIKEAVEALKTLDVLGFNLTMPLKTAVIPYLDELSKAAILSNSVNTVVNENGRLIGHTTDGIGYMDSIKDAGFDILGKKMVLLGAGGAATSIATQAALDGVSDIFIFKRKNATFEDAITFADTLNNETSCNVRVCDINDLELLEDCINQSSIITNATNVGMGDDNSSLIPIDFIREDIIVSDIIYHPAMTKLLKDAAEKNASYVNGMYMLLFQGAAAFELWTKEKMPIQYIKDTVFC